MEASFHVVKEAGARIDIEKIESGGKVYLRGNGAGIDPSAWESLRRTKVFYKAPITKPQGGRFDLLMIDNRGVKVWPDGMSETLCTDAYRRRFSAKGSTTPKQTVALLGRMLDQGIEVVKTETLRSFDGTPGYTLAQGQ